MARKKTIEELREEMNRAEQDLKNRQQKLASLKQKEKELTQKARTHRLCTHGAMLEQYLKHYDYTDEQIAIILKNVYRRSDTIELLERIRHQAEMEGRTQ